MVCEPMQCWLSSESGPVSVTAVADGVNLHLVLSLVDPEDDQVSPTASRVVSIERLVQGFANPVWVNRDRALDRLHRGQSYFQRQVLTDVATSLPRQEHRIGLTLVRIRAGHFAPRCLRCSSSARTCPAL